MSNKVFYSFCIAIGLLVLFLASTFFTTEITSVYHDVYMFILTMGIIFVSIYAFTLPVSLLFLAAYIIFALYNLTSGKNKVLGIIMTIIGLVIGGVCFFAMNAMSGLY